MDPLTRMVEHHIWLTGEMIERAAGLGDDQLDQPSVDGKTLRRMLSRLIGQLDMWGRVISNQRYDWLVEQHEDVAAMRDRFAQAAPRFLAEVHEAVGGGRLDDMFINAQHDPPRVYTYGWMIEHVLTFAAHNRTMAMLALKQAGITDLSFCISQAVGEACIDPSLSHDKPGDARGATREAR